MSVFRKAWKLVRSLPGRIYELRHKPASWLVPRVLLVLAVLLGVGALATAVNGWLAVAALAVAGLAMWPRFDEFAGRALAAAVIATIALVGLNAASYLVSKPAGKWLEWVAAVAMFGLVLFGLRRKPRWRTTMLLSFAVLGLGFLAGAIPGEPGIVVGLVVALALFGLVAYWWMWSEGWHKGWTALVSAALAVLLILVPPIVVGRQEENSRKVIPNERLASDVDVLIVTDGRSHPLSKNPLRDPARGFDVRYSVGYATGRRVQWTLAGARSASWALRVAAKGAKAPRRVAEAGRREPADPVLLLLVDGTDPVTEQPDKLRAKPGGGATEFDRWRAVAEAAGAADNPPIPTFALLQTTDKQRLAQWSRISKFGQAVSIQELGSPSVADAGVRLTVGASTSQQDFNLAVAHRPLLLFDGEEPVPRPLSVASLFSRELVRLCDDKPLTGTDCGDPIRDALQLRNGGTHLKIERPTNRELFTRAQRERGKADEAADALAANLPVPGAAPPATLLNAPITDGDEVLGQDTTIYVHPVSSGNLLYLDYWWYLSDNPAKELGLGAFCGAGLVIPGKTCHDHQSDWEGLTVVVNRAGETPFVVAVQYAQHEKVVRYDWRGLVHHWMQPRRRDLGVNELPVTKDLARIADATGRPLAFAARGTHATYPTPCKRKPCKQDATEVKENPHRGDLQWIGNYTMTCGDQDCLQVLPTRQAGSKPALWNDFKGPWGERRCVLTYYCDAGTAPAAPGSQHRYNRPTHYDATVDENWKFKAEAGG